MQNVVARRDDDCVENFGQRMEHEIPTAQFAECQNNVRSLSVTSFVSVLVGDTAKLRPLRETQPDFFLLSSPLFSLLSGMPTVAAANILAKIQSPLCPVRFPVLLSAIF